MSYSAELKKYNIGARRDYNTIYSNYRLINDISIILNGAEVHSERQNLTIYFAESWVHI